MIRAKDLRGIVVLALARTVDPDSLPLANCDIVLGDADQDCDFSRYVDLQKRGWAIAMLQSCRVDLS